MHFLSTTFAALALGATTALAHGSLSKVAIDGVVYPGALPGHAPLANSPIRLISDVSPVKLPSTANLACGLGVTGPAAAVAPAKPGSAISFGWVNGNGGNWVHNTGPVMTYLAKCEGTTCDKFDQADAKWFKIHEAGKQADGTWLQAELMKGNTMTVNLPKDLASGDYLIRHELVALQLAGSPGGAEFYPACVQLRVSGSGAGTPSATTPTAKLYGAQDKGVLVPDVYEPGAKYTFPGPPVSNLAAAGAAVTAPIDQWKASSVGAGSPIAAPAASGTAKAPGATPSSGGSCSLKKHAARSVHRPVRVSRVMRRVMAELEALEAELAKEEV